MTTTPQSRKWQFSLRGVLVFTTAIAFLLLIATRVGLIEAGGVAIAMILAVVFMRLKGNREAWVLRPFVGIVMAVVVWGVGVDVSEFATSCPRCRLHGDDQQVRLFSVPLYSLSSSKSQEVLSMIASDLGQPCQHEFEQTQMVRLWGLVYANPSGSFCGMGGFADEEWYHEPLRIRMRAIGREHPELAKEFHDRVIVNQEYKYYSDFIIKFRTEHDPSYQAVQGSNS